MQRGLLYVLAISPVDLHCYHKFIEAADWKMRLSNISASRWWRAWWTVQEWWTKIVCSIQFACAMCLWMKVHSIVVNNGDIVNLYDHNEPLVNTSLAEDKFLTFAYAYKHGAHVIFHARFSAFPCMHGCSNTVLYHNIRVIAHYAKYSMQLKYSSKYGCQELVRDK